MEDINILLNKIKKIHAEILKDNLVGIYIHGSIAFNCFNWKKSDIDYIVVVRNPLAVNVKLELMRSITELANEAPPKGLEMSIVLEEHCQSFKYPTPFELHFSNFHLQRYQNSPENFCRTMNGADRDLAAHFTIIKNCGIVLYGSPISSVFGEVPERDYIDSIKFDIDAAEAEIVASPMYFVLTLCRVMAYMQDNLIVSKAGGGEWGIKNLDTKYADLINQALICYRTDKAMQINEKEAIEFCKYVLAQF